MGTITFIKNGKKIELPEFIFSIFKTIPGFYEIKRLSDENHINFAGDVTQIIFNTCLFKDSLYFDLNNQNLIFMNCVFNAGDFDFKNGNIQFVKSKFNSADIYFDYCDTVLFSIPKQIDDSLITGFANEFHMVGIKNFIKVIDIKADKIMIDSSELYIDCFELITRELVINDCYIEAINYISLCYSDLQMSDSCLDSKFGTIDFFVPDCEEHSKLVASYNKKVTDIDLLDERNQALYSLSSVLKGCLKKSQKINQSNLQEEKAKLIEKRNIHLGKIATEIQYLEQKRNSINGSFEAEQRKLVKKYEDKKIKDI